MNIHPTAIVEKGAKVGFGTVIGAYSVIGSNVTIGRDCYIGPHVVLGEPCECIDQPNNPQGRVIIGDNCRFCTPDRDWETS